MKNKIFYSVLFLSLAYSVSLWAATSTATVGRTGTATPAVGYASPSSTAPSMGGGNSVAGGTSSMGVGTATGVGNGYAATGPGSPNASASGYSASGYESYTGPVNVGTPATSGNSEANVDVTVNPTVNPSGSSSDTTTSSSSSFDSDSAQ